MAHTLNAPPERFNFAQHLFTLNSGRSSKLAYIDDVSTLSYAELEDRSRRLAAGLLSLGLRREERVLLLMHDGVDWPVSFLGCLYAGLVPVAVNTLLTSVDCAYMLAHSRSQAVIVSDALLDTLQTSRDSVTNESCHLIVSHHGRPLAAGVQRFEVLLEHPPLPTAADTAADDIAFWLYSSGSTGQPKGTVHTHGNPYWTIETYARQVLGLRESDVVFSAAKLFFAYGLGNSLSFPLAAGATTVLMAERATPTAVFKRLRDHQPSVFHGVPTLYVAMLASPELPQPDDLALRLCVSAGEALPREIGERFQARFCCDILDGIGSTEMLHIFLSNAPGDVHYGSSGRPVPGYQIALRDDGGLPVRDGEIGDLYIRGPSAALMYWTQRGKSNATFQGEWLRSGDKYIRDAEGRYTHAGRSDDMLKVSGQYVSPSEVEAALLEHAAVLEAAVIGITDNSGLTKTKAYVVLKAGCEGSPVLESELKIFVKDRLTPHKYPRHIAFIDELPKTATGKIQRFKLRELEQGVATPTA